MIKDQFLLCLETIFKDVLLSKLDIKHDNLKARYKRIIVQDSTIVRLPKRLFSVFSGVSNGCVQVANARIQLIIDILSSRFIQFKVNTYSTNDLAAADQLSIQKGDLVLRDRGYFSIAEIIRIINSKADFIYRYKHGIGYYDLETMEPTNLLKTLDKKKTTDIKVKLTGINGPIVRLIAMPIENGLANMRRVKLKKEAKCQPKKEVLALLSWSIFITSIDDEDVNYEEIFKLYKLRWRIEIFFKTLKSQLKLDSIHNVSENQLKVIVLAKMLLILLILQFFYGLLYRPVKELFKKNLSLIKLTRLIIDNKNILRELIEFVSKKIRGDSDIMRLLLKYCTYDQRKRDDYADQFCHIP